VFENRVLRKIFVSKRDKLTGSWRKLQMSVDTFLFLTKYSSGDNIKMNGMVGTCSTC
jgi:hypothetical protein